MRQNLVRELVRDLVAAAQAGDLEGLAEAALYAREAGLTRADMGDSARAYAVADILAAEDWADLEAAGAVLVDLIAQAEVAAAALLGA